MKILLAEDDKSTRSGIENYLTRLEHDVIAVENGDEAYNYILSEKCDLILTDVKMPKMTGLQLLDEIKKLKIDCPIIVMTSFATVKDAVEAMRNGAQDYLTKPLDLEELKLKINKIENLKKLINENRELKSRINLIEFPELIGESKSMKEIKQLIMKISADPDVSVMIYGDSGTGKELAAKSIHNKSVRACYPFVPINCAALPDELLESELFGHIKGSFTGAYKDKEGLILSAENGTLFLDEVSEMSQKVQAKLLRVLQDHIVQPVGSTESYKVNIRIIGASNKELSSLVKNEKFREDLFYRLNVVELIMPPLKNRKEDIPILVSFFADKQNAYYKFSNDALDILQNYPWQGNVRELENFLRRLQVTINKEVITACDLPESFVNAASAQMNGWEKITKESNYQTALSSAIEIFEKTFLSFHLKKNHGNVSQTSDSIGLSRVSLYKKIKQYELTVDGSEEF